MFAEREDFLLNGLGSEELAARVVSATKLIRGCCRGFVDVVGDAFSYGKPYRVDFTHRSVPEFMLAEAREHSMQYVLNGFDVLNAVSLLILAEALADPGCCTYPLLWANLSELVAWRADRSMDTTSYSFLEAMSRASHIFCSHVGESWICQMEVVAGRSHRPTDQVGDSALLFVVDALQERPQHRGGLGLVDFLFDRGLTPQTPTDIALLEIYDLKQVNWPVWKAATTTVWQHLLLKCYEAGNPGGDGSSQLPGLGGFLERFLERGADPYFQITVERTKGPTQMTGLGVQVTLFHGNSLTCNLVLGRENG